MALFELRKLLLQTRMRSHPVGLDVWFLVGPFVYFHTSCMRTAKPLARLRGCSGETARMRRLAWAFAGRLCDKYHNLMSWLILSFRYCLWAGKMELLTYRQRRLQVTCRPLHKSKLSPPPPSFRNQIKHSLNNKFLRQVLFLIDMHT